MHQLLTHVRKLWREIWFKHCSRFWQALHLKNADPITIMDIVVHWRHRDEIDINLPIYLLQNTVSHWQTSIFQGCTEVISSTEPVCYLGDSPCSPGGGHAQSVVNNPVTHWNLGAKIMRGLPPAYDQVDISVHFCSIIFLPLFMFCVYLLFQRLFYFSTSWHVNTQIKKFNSNT